MVFAQLDMVRAHALRGEWARVTDLFHLLRERAPYLQLRSDPRFIASERAVAAATAPILAVYHAGAK